MRSLILSFAASLLVTFASAQQISGVATDAGGKPLGGTTVSLIKDSAVLKLAVTTENGAYSFNGIKEGTYRISASHVSHQPVFSAPFTVNGADVKVPNLVMEKAAADLKGVTVTSKKPLIEVKADRTILNVEGTINATGSDALDLLRKSPGVMVDKDENLSLSGKNGVQVYIDNRPSPLAGQELANYLKTLQSSQIESIEIITNPSAKYEAAGNAGIINIRLKKNKAFGTNGSVNAGVNFGFYPKYNGGFSLNHRNRNINIYGNYNYSNGRNRNKIALVRSVGDTLFNQKGTINFNNDAHNFKIGADYTLNKKSSFGVIINGTIAMPEITNDGRTEIIYAPTSTIDRILLANNNTDMRRDNVNFNLNYNYTGTDGKSLVLNADHGYYDIKSNQLQPNYYFTPGGAPISSVIYRMIAPTEIKISSMKADYEQNFAKGKLGLGGKVSMVNTDNNFQRFNVVSGSDELDKDRSNRFKYQEDIYAAYANFNRAFKGGMLQVGVRMEHTKSEGVSTGQKDNGGGYEDTRSTFDRDYTDFVPSAAITFNKNPMKQWSFTYSRRIDRPAYQDLNPFEFKLDEYTFQKGNTTLKPQYTNSFGITHTYKYKLTATLNYSHVKDIFTMLIDTAEKSKAFITKENLATQDIVSLNISYPFMYKDFMAYINVNTFYSDYKADFGPGRDVDLQAFGLSVVNQNTIKFGKTKAWTAEMTTIYNAPTVMQGAFKTKSMFGMDLGLQKQILKTKGTVKLAYSDLFNTFRFRATNEFGGQKTNVTARWESQQVKLSFSWRFGNNQVKAAKQKNAGSDDENKRTQGGGAGLGIGQ
jgi:iron complex outermembrane recepter protein